MQTDLSFGWEQYREVQITIHHLVRCVELLVCDKDLYVMKLAERRFYDLLTLLE